MDRSLTDEGHAAAALKEHADIYDALADRDAEAVVRTMRSPMETASRRLLAAFEAPSTSAPLRDSVNRLT